MAQAVVEVEKIASMCGICDAGCGVHVHMREGRIERLTPIKEHPLGIVCPRGARAAEIVYSPDRLLYPQKRIGARGEGKFERISWDDAYEIWLSGMRDIADRHGPEAMCMYTGRGNFEFGVQESFPPIETSESSASSILFPFGSPNTTGVGALCFVAYGMIAPQACFGQHYRHIGDDFANADLVLVWGANPATDSPPGKMKKIKKAQKNGARVICIDHRHSETAKAVKAEWLSVRPGTDGALALAIANVMIAEGLYDKAFVEHWCHGFDAYRDYVAAFTPDRASAITGVAAEDIVDLARAIGKARGCVISMYTGLEYSNSGVQSIRAVLCLQALGGFIDVPGGKIFKMPDRPMHNRTTTAPPATGVLPIGAERYPIYHELRKEAHGGELPRAILEGDPYPIRGLIISGASIATSWPDPGLWYRAFASLDLLVAVNRFPTADSLYADLVLPATTGFEIESYQVDDGYAQWRQRIIEPRGEARPDYLIFAELAERLGYGDLWPASEEANIRRGIEGLGITLEDLRAAPEGIQLQMPRMRYRKYESGELRADGKPGFATPTGKFEFTSEWLRGHGYEPLPVYVEPTEGPISTPETASTYPLVFNSGARTQSTFRTQHHNIPGLNALQPLPQVWLHPQDAAARGIRDDMAVDVVSPRGTVRFHAFVTEDIKAGCVEANMGGGNPVGPAAWRSCNVNVLTDPDNCDPISGFPVYKALLCDVRPAPDA
ncbi:MAG: molybdopterin-dependent oxidoreductase [Alphaproteobacteria bacterium]|nr:molybdopterin-dependent oxidoreductase [Alphaproteobacteria bacterium]